MGLVFPVGVTTSRKNDVQPVKPVKKNIESNVSLKQTVKPLTLRNKIFLRSEINYFKNNE